MTNLIPKLTDLFSDESRNGVISNLTKFFLAFPTMPITIPISGIQAAIFTSLIGFCGFVGGSGDQSAHVLQGTRVGAGIIPSIFVLLGILPMLFSPITLAKEKELSKFSELRRR